MSKKLDLPPSKWMIPFLILLGAVVVAAFARLIAVLPLFQTDHRYPSTSTLKQTNKIDTKAKGILEVDYNGKKTPKVMVLLGSGGHTGEMIRILSQVDLSPLNRTWIVSSGDTTSATKAKWYEETHCSNSSNSSEILELHRARKVGESLVLSVKNTLVSFVKTVSLVYNRMPNALLLNGPGTSVPLAYVLFFFKYLGIGNTKIIYVESLARLQSLSVSGILVLPIADRFIVQSEVLAHKYRRAEYYGILV